MRAFLRRSVGRVVLAGVVFAAAAAGIAYAAIPDGNGVYTACMLDKVGTIRLIDPSLPSSNLMSHCSSVEKRLTFNQQGPPGAPGADGADGVSPTVAQLASGDSHCSNGGAAITDANGSTAYVCNGNDGQSFSGSFTSPNGIFSMKVTDSGITLSGGQSHIDLDSSGAITVHAQGVLTLQGSSVNLN
jgi:hypothetical protein